VTPALEELLFAAEEAARQSGEVLAARYQQQRTIEFKGGIDLVTDADKASERELLVYLRSRFPTHSILSEESGATGDDPIRWIVDPLDGTTNYSHRVAHFAVSVAVEGPQGLLAGAVFDPLRNEMFSAAKGRGARLNGEPIKTSEVDSIARALLCTGFPYDVRERPDAPIGLFNRFVVRAQGVRRFGSAALDLAYVASGRFDGFFEFGLKAWDVAAGALVVSEAGGVISCIDGTPLNLFRGDVMASSRLLEPTLRKEIAAFLAEIRWKPRT
jgi:myo-inositol-1(or 4)-monophosphatase